MSALDRIDKKEIRDLLGKGWLTHDGMWFYHAFMGLVIVFAIKPLVHHLPFEGLLWLFAGGISYTIGAILYSIKKIKFNHAVFHILVLIGSFCHFVSVFFYVLPSE